MDIKKNNDENNITNNISEYKKTSKDDRDLIIDYNTIYEIDRKCFEKYICKRNYPK